MMAMPIRINKQAFLKGILLAAMVFCPGGSGLFSSGKEVHAKQVFARMESHQAMRITIVYDNNPYDPRLRPDWGFSCVINLGETAILFDTGGDGVILVENMKRLGIDPKKISAVFISHIHGDHVGGLPAFLRQNSKVTVYVPGSFPARLKEEIRYSGAVLEEVRQAREVSPGLFTTGELDGGIKEQSLVLQSPRGLVVITGCAHPGIVNVVRKAKEIGKDRLHLVLGGFHLGGATSSTIEEIIGIFLEWGVKKIVPCHCSGDRARKLFEKHFGSSYIPSGVGKEFTIAEWSQKIRRLPTAALPGKRREKNGDDDRKGIHRVAPGLETGGLLFRPEDPECR
jgi:7,8-dihydropterin-6-yl-methyl-4-(beta-D-ribofuranosyl)aminobenzene 5'-phosphate synthase